MEDLDSLLEDLGKGKSASTVKKQRPPSSRVDLNELENLMEDLAAPAAKQPESRPVSMYSANGNSSKPTPTPTPAPAPATNNYESRPQSMVMPAAHPDPAPVLKTSTQNQNSSANIDDLDALMESLNASSSRPSSRRTSTAPTAAPSNPPPSQSYTAPPPREPVQAPKQTASHSSQSYTAPPPKANPVYTPPAQSYPPATTYTPAAAPPPQKKPDDLDSLLQNLTSQMNSIDTDNPSSRGTCHTCKGAILGEVIQALGKSFHPEHFTCGNCRTPLGTTNFFEHNGTPHCERCYQELYCPKCAHCDGPVLDRCITALGKKWHVDHFICTQCLKPFQGGNFFERDGRPYCEQDFYGIYAPKCAGCNEAIRGDCINALGSQWHPEHFCCSYCQKSFAGGSFYEHGGKPYCETHYHQQTGSLCAGCGKSITGRCVNALDKKWHPEHFVCAFCMNPLAGGSFTEHNNKAYCKECHGKLWSSA